MKKSVLTKTLLTALFLSCSLSAIAVSPEKANSTANYEVVPVPHKISKGTGNPFILDSTTTIVCDSDNPTARKNAEMLAGYIKELTGLSIPVSFDSGTSGSKQIRLVSSLTAPSPDAFKLTVTPEIITIDGASPSGTFYGIQTLRKSIPSGSGESVAFPSAEI